MGHKSGRCYRGIVVVAVVVVVVVVVVIVVVVAMSKNRINQNSMLRAGPSSLTTKMQTSQIKNVVDLFFSWMN